MEETQCRYFINSHSRLSRCRDSWILQSYKSELIKMKEINTYRLFIKFRSQQYICLIAL